MTDQLPTLDDAERFFAQQHGIEPLEKLPYPAVQLPEYRAGKYRSWQLDRQDMPLLRGYFNGLQVNDQRNYVLSQYRKGTPTIWMSLTPMERESHMPHIAAARGSILCVGLGMGMYLYNILQKPEVTEVTVIERNEAVVNFVRKRAKMGEWPNIEKLKVVVHKDVFSEQAKNCTPVQDGFDTVYVDIWSTLGDEKARQDMVTIAKAFKSDAQSWWGMELDFIEWCTIYNRADLQDGAKLTDEMVKASAMPWVMACQTYGLNVTGVTANPEWPRLALRAAHNVTLY